MSSQPKIGIILVNLNSYDHTSKCLLSLRNMTYANSQVIVVDNGSSDMSGTRLAQEFPEATYLRSETNEGFTGGNNLGIAYALQNGCEHVVLLNNDTIVTPSFLEPLVERLLSDDSIAAVSGKIYFYPPVVGGKDRIIWYAGAHQRWHLAYTHDGESQEDKGQYDTAKEVDYACGCLMLMRGELLREMGPLANEYFIYWEESDWCLQARARGYSSWYEPRSVIYHNFHSPEHGKETAFYMYLLYRNFLIYAHKHYHGLKRVRFWLTYPLHLLNRSRACLFAGNTKGFKAIWLGALDYCKGYRGKRGLKERGLLR